MSRAIELNGGAGLCDEGDFRLVVGARELGERDRRKSRFGPF